LCLLLPDEAGAVRVAEGTRAFFVKSLKLIAPRYLG
jgi:hypothetical protein